MEKERLYLRALDEYRYVLTKTYVYEVDISKLNFYENKTITIRVPRGFVTDLTSSPRIIWTFFPPCGNYTKAAIVHDYLYSKNCKINCSREIADKIFLLIMKEIKVSFIKRRIIYRAVRIFGGMYFRK